VETLYLDSSGKFVSNNGDTEYSPAMLSAGEGMLFSGKDLCGAEGTLAVMTVAANYTAPSSDRTSYAFSYYLLQDTPRYTQLAGSGTASALVTDQKFDANGQSKNITIYNINNNNFFKLRDIAALCIGTDKAFSISYDAQTNCTTLTVGGTYTALPTDLAPPSGVNQTAVQSITNVIVNGKRVVLTSYNINGFNYYKLRDLCQVLDIRVTWNAETRTMGIDTTRGYE